MWKTAGFSPTSTTLGRFFKLRLLFECGLYMCNLSSEKVRLLIKCGFYTRLYGIQPGAVKLVLWRHWMHVTQVHWVKSENQFHSTRLYTTIWNKKMDLFRKLGSVPEEDLSFWVQTSSINQFAGKRRAGLLKWMPMTMLKVSFYFHFQICQEKKVEIILL